MTNLKKKGFFRLVFGDTLLDLNDAASWEKVAAMREADRPRFSFLSTGL